MELLSPAGNVEKLKYAYLYGADAAYIGIKNFSLRQKADNFKNDEYKIIADIKKNKKLYGALNIYFHEQDLDKLYQELDYIKKYPFDAFIISDIGIIKILKETIPNTELHLSTQANCINSEAAKIYRDMGFTRIVLGRETSLKEIEKIKKTVPEIEIETFIHGAMCLAYSGRCFLSAWMAGRSGNTGNCSHSCRWDYRVLEEAERPGEYYPIYEGENFTSILSSKDICMIDHLKDLKNAGVDSLKIEGRMKSIYYTSIITRAYRKAIDNINSNKDIQGYIEEIYKVSHREFSTGFYFDKNDIQKPTEKSYLRQFTFMGIIGKPKGENSWELIVKNKIKTNIELEYIGPNLIYERLVNYLIFDEKNNTVTEADHGKQYTIKSKQPLEEGYILRAPSKDFTS